MVPDTRVSWCGRVCMSVGASPPAVHRGTIYRLLKVSKLACGPSENLRISLLNDRLLVVVLKIETPILYRFAKRCIFMDCKFNAIFLASIVVKLAYLSLVCQIEQYQYFDSYSR